MIIEQISQDIRNLDANVRICEGGIYHINKNFLKGVLKQLKKQWRFTMLTDLFAADFPEREERFEVVYNLLCFEHNLRLVLKVSVADKQQLSSVVEVFSAANWYEREVYDMFGIIFQDHPGLERILTDYGFVGHPLRKDFPLTGYRQVKYDEHLEQVVYEPVDLEQNFRSFDFSSPWQGPLLPGDEKASK